jgi:predicted O-methyltransferase YrrM
VLGRLRGRRARLRLRWAERIRRSPFASGWGVMDEDYLPQDCGVDRELRRNRSIYDGYRRGAGLQRPEVQERILADPLYWEALAVADGRSIVEPVNRQNLFLLLRFYLARIPLGHIIEFGTYRGGNAIFMAYLASRLYPGMKVYALDTFEGMPPTDRTRDSHHEGDFADVDLEELQAYVDSLELDNLILVQGRFEDTAPEVLAKAGQIALAHVDCDIYSAVAYAYDAVKDYMVEGGYLVFDDATSPTCIGATEAVEDLLIRRDGLSSEQISPHYVFRAPARAI